MCSEKIVLLNLDCVFKRKNHNLFVSPMCNLNTRYAEGKFTMHKFGKTELYFVIIGLKTCYTLLYGLYYS